MKWLILPILTFTGSICYAGFTTDNLKATVTMTIPNSATPPSADCDAESERGRIYVDTNAVSGQQFYACEGTSGWVQQGGSTISSSTIPSGSTNYIQNTNSLQSGATFYVSSGTIDGQLVNNNLTASQFVKTGSSKQLVSQALVDISGETNLSVSAPITLTGDDVGIDKSSATLLGPTITLGTETDGIYVGSITTNASLSLTGTNNAESAAPILGVDCSSGTCLGNSIDISGETNLAVEAPITLTGDTVGIDKSSATLLGPTITLGTETDGIYVGSVTVSSAFSLTGTNNVESAAPIFSANTSSITLQGNTFNGANQLLQLNASSDVPDANLSSNVPLLNATQTFTGQNTFSNAVTISTTIINLQRIQWSDGTVQVSSPGAGGGTGDIEGVTAGAGLSGGGTSGTVTLSLDPNATHYIHNQNTLQSGASFHVSSGSVLAELIAGTMTPTSLLNIPSGSVLPSTASSRFPLFLHTPTGRKILQEYDGTQWRPIIAYGNTDIFVSTNGSNTPACGTAAGANACQTIQYAIDLIPAVFTSTVTITLSTGIYREAVTLMLKIPSGNFKFVIQGTTLPVTSGTAAAGANPTTGDGAAGYGTLRVSGTPWSSNQFQEMLVHITGGTGSGQSRVVHINNTSTITIVGRWDTAPDATSTFQVFTTTGTRITGANAGAETTAVRDWSFKLENQPAFVFDLLTMDYAGTTLNDENGVLLLLKGSAVEIKRCRIQHGTAAGGFGLIGLQTFSTLDLKQTVFIGGIYDSLRVLNSYISQIEQCRFRDFSADALGLYSNSSNLALHHTYINATAVNSRGVLAHSGSATQITTFTEIEGTPSGGSQSGDGVSGLASGLIQLAEFPDASGSGTSIVIKNNGGFGITVGDLDNDVSGLGAVSFSGNTAGNYRGAESGPPTVVAGTGAGAGATVTVAGNDKAGTITLDTSALDTPAANADIVTVTFASGYNIAPRVLINCSNDACWNLAYGISRIRQSDTTTALFILRSGGVPLPALTASTLTWNYFVRE